MITGWDVYWITRLTALNGFFEFTGLITLLAVLGIFSWVYPIITDVYSYGPREKLWKIYRRTMIGGTITGIILILISLFIPTTKEMAAIYIIPNIANNKQVQKIPDNAATLLNTKLEQWIDETMLKDKKDKK